MQRSRARVEDKGGPHKLRETRAVGRKERTMEYSRDSLNLVSEFERQVSFVLSHLEKREKEKKIKKKENKNEK